MSFARAFVVAFLSILSRACIGVIVACALSQPAKPQDPSDYLFQTGAPSLAPIDKFPGGTIQLANGNLHIEIPLGGFPQRGSLLVSAKLVYDSRMVWAIAATGHGYYWATTESLWA